MIKSIFNKHLSRIVDASWFCIEQEDELIDLSVFSSTLFPTILWLSAVSYRTRSSNTVVVSENSPFAFTFLDCSGLTTKSYTKTLDLNSVLFKRKKEISSSV